MSKSNKVTIFSNGMADFVRRYPAANGQKTKISIPVRKNHVADVLASLNLFGEIKLDSPPSFRPDNSDNSRLEIDTSDVLESLATSLSGAKVEATTSGEVIEGTLVGIYNEPNISAQGRQDVTKELVVLTSTGLKKIPFYCLKNLNFTEEGVQSEIDKALKRNFEQIKPNSTFVDLSVTGQKEGAEAVVQYTIPSAAWKISYRLQTDTDGTARFKGLAIVDNNTDEDWKDVEVSVVTGEPITFSTDLAESKTPARSHINVVRDSAIGAVEVEQGRATRLSKKSAARGMAAAACAGFSPMADSGYESIPSVIQCCSDPESLGLDGYGHSNAMISQTEKKEVGDFSIFTSSNPVTIPAQQSALIPVFDANLKNSKTVLHFSSQNNPTRPYRSLQFTNETSHALGRGVCTVYQDEVYSGNCILPATKQGEEQLLPFALETGVKINQENKSGSRTIASLSLRGGLCSTKYLQRQVVEYSVTNAKDEAFELYIDHSNYLGNEAKTVAILDSDTKGRESPEKVEVAKDLAAGKRFAFTLQPKETVVLSVIQSYVETNSIQLCTNHYDWFMNTFVRNEGPLSNFDGLEELNKVVSKIAKAKTEKTNLQNQIQKLSKKQERLRDNIKAAGKVESADFLKELKDTEAKLVQIEDVDLPATDKKLLDLDADLASAFNNLTTEWQS